MLSLEPAKELLPGLSQGHTLIVALEFVQQITLELFFPLEVPQEAFEQVDWETLVPDKFLVDKVVEEALEGPASLGLIDTKPYAF